MAHTNFDQDDEVSLKEFKSQLEQFRIFLRQVVFNAASLVKRYFLLLVLLFLVFAGMAMYQFKYSRSYTAKASFIYIESQKKTYGEMIDKLQEMLKTKSYGQIAKALNIPLDQAYQVYSIEATNIKGAKLSEDITEDSRSFYIAVSAGNNIVFDTLQSSLLYYFNNNPLIRLKMSANKKRIEENIAYLKQELVKMDSLKGAYTNSLAKPATSVSPASNPFNPVELYEKSEKINREISDLNAVISNNYTAVQLLDGFMVSQAPNQSMLSIVAKCFIYFLLSSFALIFILSIFKIDPVAAQ